jgi:hypothetical protein
VISELESAQHPLQIPPTVHLAGDLLTPRMDYACRVADSRTIGFDQSTIQSQSSGIHLPLLPDVYRSSNTAFTT